MLQQKKADAANARLPASQLVRHHAQLETRSALMMIISSKRQALHNALTSYSWDIMAVAGICGSHYIYSLLCRKRRSIGINKNTRGVPGKFLIKKGSRKNDT